MLGSVLCKQSVSGRAVWYHFLMHIRCTLWAIRIFKEKNENEGMMTTFHVQSKVTLFAKMYRVMTYILIQNILMKNSSWLWSMNSNIYGTAILKPVHVYRHLKKFKPKRIIPPCCNKTVKRIQSDVLLFPAWLRVYHSQLYITIKEWFFNG